MPSPDIALCYGTRPQVIKASVLREELGRSSSVLAVDTGQHYDYALNALLYEQLGVRPPDLFLEVGSGSHGEQTAGILTRVEQVLREQRPRAAVVIGDTNSTLGCALAAAKLRIPVVHVEAGLRATDALMAEEINRRAVDAVAALLCTPSAAATRRVRAERPDARVVETGDVSYDVLQRQTERLPGAAAIVPEILSGEYIYATLHRAELTDRPEVLLGVLGALDSLDRRVVVAVHPRTRAVLEARGLNGALTGSVTLIPAVGYLESLALAREAAAVVTDSGGLQREAYWLGTPCITIRSETEWGETIECGANRLVAPLVAQKLLATAITEQCDQWRSEQRWPRTAYGSGHAAELVTQAVRELI